MANKRQLKIGLVFDDSLDSSDGVAQYVKTLGAWLSISGHEVIYLVGETKIKDWKHGKVYSLSKNIKVKFNGNHLSIPLPANLKKIKQVLSHEQPDILHIMVPYSPFMAQRVISAVRRNIAIVGTFHIYPAGKLARFGGRLLGFWYGTKVKRINPIVSVSSAAQDYAQQTFRIQSEIIPNPVNIKRFSSARIPNVQNDIVFLGRLVKRKGCNELIDAFYNLSKLHPDVSLIIAGDGPLRTKLESKCKKLDIANRVKFLGYVSEADKPGLLAAARIACFPSLYGESFGIVLLEAMAAGAKVVLGGDNPGYRSVLAQEPNLLISPCDTGAFTRRLHMLLTDNVEAERLNKWQAQAVKQYDIEVVGPKLLSIYNEQIARQIEKSHNKKQ